MWEQEMLEPTAHRKGHRYIGGTGRAAHGFAAACSSHVCFGSDAGRTMEAARCVDFQPIRIEEGRVPAREPESLRLGYLWRHPAQGPASRRVGWLARGPRMDRFASRTGPRSSRRLDRADDRPGAA